MSNLNRAYFDIFLIFDDVIRMSFTLCVCKVSAIMPQYAGIINWIDRYGFWVKMFLSSPSFNGDWRRQQQIFINIIWFETKEKYAILIFNAYFSLYCAYVNWVWRFDSKSTRADWFQYGKIKTILIQCLNVCLFLLFFLFYQSKSDSVKIIICVLL